MPESPIQGIILSPFTIWVVDLTCIVFEPPLWASPCIGFRYVGIVCLIIDDGKGRGIDLIQSPPCIVSAEGRYGRTYISHHERLAVVDIRGIAQPRRGIQGRGGVVVIDHELIFVRMTKKDTSDGGR